MIQFSEVRKRFGRRGVEALGGVDFTVSAGERLAVVGPNGAGKSTLLALALGFLRPSSGLVRLEGEDPRVYLRRNGAGWVPERFPLPATWKVRAAAEHFARLDGGRPVSAPAAAVLEHFGLAGHAGRPVAALSHGLARRLVLAIATLTPRRLMVFDEPTEGLDSEGRDRFEARCAWLRNHGSTLLLASQDAGAVGRLADRVLRLDRGRVVGEATAPSAPDGLTYQIELEQPSSRIAEVFPGATAWPEGNTYRVLVADTAELNAGIRSLLDAGGAIVSVHPATPGAGSEGASTGHRGGGGDT